MPGKVADVPHIEWDVVGNDSEAVIKEKMDFLQAQSEIALEKLDESLEDLRHQITSASMPGTSIDYSHIDTVIESGIQGLRPDAPEFPDTNGIEKPVRRDLEDISIPVFPDIPGFNETAPTDTFSWTEPDYESTVLTALRSSTIDWITNGGTGLAEDVEEAIFDRARTRLTEEWETAFEDADKFYSSRGWNIPHGPKQRMLRRVNADFNRKVEDLNQKILEVQANLAQNNTQFAHTLAIDLEKTLEDFFEKVTSRMFDAAKSTVTLLYEVFKYKVDAYVAVTDGLKTEIAAKTEIVKAQTEVNKGINDFNVSENQRYSAEVNAVVGVIDGLAKVYSAEINGYDADISLEKSNLQARIEKLKAMISQASDETQLQIKEAEVNLQAYISSLGLNIEVSKTIAGILSQLVSSTLRGINTGVTMTDHASRTYQGSYSHHESLGNGYTHSYHETKE